MPQKETFQTLIDQARNNPDSRESVMRLLQGIGQRFVGSKDKPEEIQAISDELHSHAAAIVDAIVAKLPGATDAGGPEATQTQRALGVQHPQQEVARPHTPVQEKPVPTSSGKSART